VAYVPYDGLAKWPSAAVPSAAVSAEMFVALWHHEPGTRGNSGPGGQGNSGPGTRAKRPGTEKAADQAGQQQIRQPGQQRISARKRGSRQGSGGGQGQARTQAQEAAVGRVISVMELAGLRASQFICVVYLPEIPEPCVEVAGNFVATGWRRPLMTTRNPEIWIPFPSTAAASFN
jgi:hypothetical protein